jgi:hypothetical protein
MTELDTFDRVIGAIDGLPDVHKSRPTTVTTVMPIVGRSQTYVAQTYRDKEGRFTVFLQMVDAEGRARIVVPPKVMAAVYRQRESLVTKARRATARATSEKRKLRVAEGS